MPAAPAPPQSPALDPPSRPPPADARPMVRPPIARVHGRYDAPVLLLVDLDGVVYRGCRPGARASPPSWPPRAAAGDDVVYVTNNSMHYRADYVDRLAAMGAPVSAERVVSSPRATALWLAEQDPRPRRGAGARRRRPPARARGLRLRGRDGRRRRRARGGARASTGSRPPAARTRSSSGSTRTSPTAGWRSAAEAVRAGRSVRRDEPRPGLPDRDAASCRAPARWSPRSRSPPASGPISIGKPEPLLLRRGGPRRSGRMPATR